jgi:lysozyme
MSDGLLKIVDVSHWNKLKSSREPESDVVGLIAKATEGMTFVDPTLDEAWAYAREHKLEFGVYHFLRPVNIEAQARHFVKTIAHLDNDNILYVCDWETTRVNPVQAQQFMNIVDGLTKKPCVLYSNPGTLNAVHLEGLLITRRRLWLAQYAERAVNPKGFLTHWMWQYTDNGKVNFVEGDCDISYFHSKNRDVFRKEWRASL